MKLFPSLLLAAAVTLAVHAGEAMTREQDEILLGIHAATASLAGDAGRALDRLRQQPVTPDNLMDRHLFWEIHSMAAEATESLARVRELFQLRAMAADPRIEQELDALLHRTLEGLWRKAAWFRNWLREEPYVSANPDLARLVNRAVKQFADLGDPLQKQ